jgi:hypothetical protein
MSYRKFDVPTMIAISDPLVDDKKDKLVLEAIPLTAGFVPILVAIHKHPALLRSTPTENPKVMRSLSERASIFDTEHDDRYRCWWLRQAAPLRTNWN